MNPSVVFITGGLSGIGRADTVAFAKKGAKVAVAGRRDDPRKALVKELRSLGSEADFISADVRKDGGACQRDRLHRVGRSFVPQRPHPQRRWRQEPVTCQGAEQTRAPTFIS